MFLRSSVVVVLSCIYSLLVRRYVKGSPFSDDRLLYSQMEMTLEEDIPIDSDTPTIAPAEPSAMPILYDDDGYKVINKGNDCKSKKQTTSFLCEVYHRKRIATLTASNPIGYGTDVIPNSNSSSPIISKVAIKFNDFISADSIKGSLNLGVEISLWWRNDFVNWDIVSCSKYNKSSTDVCPPYDVYELSFDSKAMWTPDFQLANDAVPWDQGFPKTIRAIVDYSGGTNMVYSGQMSFTCNFNMTDFPFDTQNCDATFSSRAYFDDALTFTFDNGVNALFQTTEQDPSQIIAKDIGYVWMDSFSHPGFKVLGISTSTGFRRSLRKSKSGADRFTSLTYTIKIKRYSSYYLYVAVGPIILIDIVALFSLFVFESEGKLNTAATCLLTIMAIQWIVASLIPITRDNPWIMRFSSTCIAYVGVICIFILFITYIEDVRDRYKTHYVLKPEFHKTVASIVDIKNTPKHDAEDELDLETAERHGTNSGNSFSLKKFFLYLNPSLAYREQEDEPMPAWLKCLINISRPRKIYKYLKYKSSHQSSRNEVTLHYNYRDGLFAVLWAFRILAIAFLAAIIGVYFTQIDSSF